MLKLERRFKIGMSLILAINLLVGISALVLFERMLPVLDHIMNHHGIILQDIEKLITMLSQLDIQKDPLLYEQFQDNVSMLEKHLTQEKNLKLVEHLQALAKTSPPWNKERLQQIMEILGELSTNNRLSLYEAYENVKFLGLTSGWIVVLIVSLGLLFGALFTYKLVKQTIEPVAEICRGLQDWRRGNQLRRFRSIEGTQDVKEAMQILNDILDEKL